MVVYEGWKREQDRDTTVLTQSPAMTPTLNRPADGIARARERVSRLALQLAPSKFGWVPIALLRASRFVAARAATLAPDAHAWRFLLPSPANT